MEKWIGLLLALLVLTGCPDSSGNGEGYTGVEKIPETAPLRDKTATMYYWLQRGYTCTDADGNKINSYRAALQVDTSGFVYYGDYCQKEPLGTGRISELTIHGPLAGYSAGIFQKETE